jgi:hypothetical protein
LIFDQVVVDDEKILGIKKSVSVDDDEIMLRKWISLLSILDKEELAVNLGVPSNIPEQQFENLIFNQLLIAASNPEIQKTFRTWSPSILIALAQCGQLRSAVFNSSYDEQFEPPHCSHHPCHRESQILAGALRSSQSSLLGALEEGRRLQAALEESERLCQDAAAARDDLRCRLLTTELEGAALRDRVSDLEEESQRIQMCVLPLSALGALMLAGGREGAQGRLR